MIMLNYFIDHVTVVYKNSDFVHARAFVARKIQH